MPFEIAVVIIGGIIIAFMGLAGWLAYYTVPPWTRGQRRIQRFSPVLLVGGLITFLGGFVVYCISLF